MGYRDKIAQARQLITDYNGSISEERFRLDADKIIGQLQIDGATNDSLLSKCRWEDLERCGFPRLLAKEVAIVFRKKGWPDKLYRNNDDPGKVVLTEKVPHPTKPGEVVEITLRESSKKDSDLWSGLGYLYEPDQKSTKNQKSNLNLNWVDPSNINATSMNVSYHLGWWSINFYKNVKENPPVNAIGSAYPTINSWFIGISRHKDDTRYNLVSKTLDSEGIKKILEYLSTIAPEHQLDTAHLQAIGRLS